MKVIVSLGFGVGVVEPSYFILVKTEIGSELGLAVLIRVHVVPMDYGYFNVCNGDVPVVG